MMQAQQRPTAPTQFSLQSLGPMNKKVAIPDDIGIPREYAVNDYQVKLLRTIAGGGPLTPFNPNYQQAVAQAGMGAVGVQQSMGSLPSASSQQSSNGSYSSQPTHVQR